MRASLVSGLVLACVASAAGAQRRPPAKICVTAEETDSIASVGERQEIRLGSGRLARLSGLHVANDAGAASPAAAWLMRHAGRPLAIAITGPEDRWGRVPVKLKLREEPRLDLAHGLIEEGLAVADTPGPCQPELLAIEETARERGVGLWADAGYKPAPADAREILAGRIGRFTLVEGRVRSVGERRQRTYLNFGPDGTKDLTITIPKRTWTTMVEKGLSATALRGARIRVRGVLEVGRGPTIEVAAAEAIEVLDRGRERR
jgi:hypothetical protein